MSTRPVKVAVAKIPRPFLCVVDWEPNDEKPRRIECGTSKEFNTARERAIAIRALFDSFFGEDADYFVMRVVDLRDYTIRFEYY